MLPAYDNDDVAECDSEEPGSLHHGLHAVRGLIPIRFVNFYFLSTVGASIMTHTKIMARSTSGDDFMPLKTSHIKSRVILFNL